jgi:hypothetical protein
MENKSNQKQGLGDTIASITHFLCIDVLAKKVAKFFGKDCGCERRRKKLNKAFPYKK